MGQIHGGRLVTGVLGVASALALALAAMPGVAAAQTSSTDFSPFPVLVHDVKTGAYQFGNTSGTNDIQDMVQADTQAEPSIAVNPQNPLNVVASYQSGRRANGGDATNG